jgi:S1-C subfamily serine protease
MRRTPSGAIDATTGPDPTVMAGSDPVHWPPPPPLAPTRPPMPPVDPTHWDPGPPPRAPSPPGVTRATRRTRTVGVLVAASICGALAGAAGGYVVADNESPTSVSSTSVSSTSVSSTTQPTTTQPTTSVPVGGAVLDVPGIFAKARPSVVTVETTISARIGPRTTTSKAAGTGIILTAAGLVLTNAHVIAGANTISVTLSDETTVLDASVVMSNTTDDIAVLQIVGASGLTPATLDVSGDIRIGEDVVAIGNALALAGGPTVTSGIVSGLHRSITTDSATLEGLIQTDAAISSGDSGGPLLDNAGSVIGLTCAGASSGQSVIAENVGFAIPIARVSAVLQQAGIVVG